MAKQIEMNETNDDLTTKETNNKQPITTEPETIPEEAAKSAKNKSKPRRMNDDDVVEVISVHGHEVSIHDVPDRRFRYTWRKYGDVVPMPYRDLRMMLSGKATSALLPKQGKAPWLIVNEEAVWQSYPELKEHAEKYTDTDLNWLLGDAYKAIAKFKAMPESAQNNIRVPIKQMIVDKKITDVGLIHTIGEAYGEDIKELMTPFKV